MIEERQAALPSFNSPGGAGREQIHRYQLCCFCDDEIKLQFSSRIAPKVLNERADLSFAETIEASRLPWFWEECRSVRCLAFWTNPSR